MIAVKKVFMAMLNYILRCIKYSSPFELKKFKSEGAALYDAIQQMLEFIIGPWAFKLPICNDNYV